MRRVIISVAMLLWASTATAQTIGVPGSKFAWEQVGDTLATVQAYTVYRHDDGGPRVVLSGVVCTGAASPFTCTAPIPAYTPGMHTVFITSANVAGESAASNTLNFNMVVTPAAPANLRLSLYALPNGRVIVVG